MTNKHTSGPWTVAHETDISGVENDPENGCVGPVDVAHVYLRMVPGRTEANARLIAAAPDLLEALKLCRQELYEWMRDHGQDIATRDAMSKARAAIQKAEGK